MTGGMYLLQGDDNLIAMTEAPYDSEDVLQSLLAKYPDLLAGDQLPGSVFGVPYSQSTQRGLLAN